MEKHYVRGMRGAISVAADESGTIAAAVKRLLRAMIESNGVEVDDIASVLFTMTPDLRAGFPAVAAREMGWAYVPMLHAVEVDVPGALPRCVRVLMHAHTSRRPEQIVHVYLDDAVVLRPDLTGAVR